MEIIEYDLDNFDHVNTEEINVLVIPQNDTLNPDDKFNYFPSTASSVLKILQNNGVGTKYLDNGKEIVYLENRDIEWVAPILFFSFSCITNNPVVIGFSINIISTYVYDIFKGLNNDPKVKLVIICEKNKSKYKKIEYEGTVSGLDKVNKIIEKL